MERTIRVIVCGTSFGRFYIQGLKKRKEHYRLVGILSTGSRQSRQIAEQEKVRLYTSAEEIAPGDADLACVVVRSGIVGGNGTKLALSFLEKGIHVVQEQPVHMADMMQCYKAAKSHGCLYFTETFYPFLPVQNRFLQLAHKIMEQTKPVYLEAACSLQVLYPMLDMVGRLFQGFTPWQLEADSLRESGMFSLLCGVVKGVPWELKVQNELSTSNPDNYFHLLHRMTLYTESGSLTMTESHGEVIWSPRYLIPRDENGVLNPYLDPELPGLKLSRSAGSEEIDIQTMFEREWPDTIGRYLEGIYRDILENRQDGRLQQQNLAAAKYWKEVGKLIGASRPAAEQKIVPIPFESYGRLI